MEDLRPRGFNTSSTTSTPPLHTLRHARRTTFNHVFMVVYTSSFFITLSLFISDIILAIIWVMQQCFRVAVVYRSEFPENLEKVVKKSDFPALDVFICTADPYKEPPIRLVSTALSVMAYDYPTEKISVYVSDDGGSQLTLFACMEAAKFASHWLPFCRKMNIIDRSPEAYFASKHSWSSDAEKIKIMYERMKVRIENVLELGKVSEEYITDVSDRRALSKWTDEFTHQDHSTIIQVLLESSKNKDITDHLMPNLIYLSREKSKTSSHHFKAGALNVLLRVSAAMTNAPIILTLDCDTYSNDPQTPLCTLCYLSDPKHQSKLGYVQFPQMFHGINKNDTYGSEYKRPFQTNPMGMDGLLGPNYVGTGCYFNRRVFFGGPSTFISPEITEISPYNLVNKPIQSQQILDLAHEVAGCNYENNTKWGFEMGFKYGSLVEDFYTGFWQKCDGWRSIFCNPKRPAFLGDAPISLIDGLIQCQRWAIGGIQVGFSKYSPITFGTRSMGLIMGLIHIMYSLLNEVSIFPKLSEPWFFLYVFLFLGAYGSDLLEFIVEGGTVQRWWNDQRMWMIRVLSSYLFASLEYFLKCLGISTYGFSLTNKVVDDEQRKRYDQGVFDFGVPSPMFVPITMAAIINFVSFFMGLMQVVKGTNSEGLFLQMFMAGFVVVNSMPIYEAIVLRRDKGRMPVKITTISTCLALSLYVLASQLLFI
ncbi:hypothetical protein ACB092_01G152400 [Castanea dentata]